MNHFHNLRPPVPVLTAPPPTIIKFDDVPDGTVINTRYTGVVFESYVDTPTHVHWDAFARVASSPELSSSPNVISINPLSSPSQTNTMTPFFGGDSGGIRATFMEPQLYVSIDAKPILPPEFTQTPISLPFLQALDAQDHSVGLPVHYPLGYGDPNYGTWQRLIVQSQSANIVSVIFSTDPSGGGTQVSGLFDNLVFAKQLFRVIFGPVLG